MLSFAPDFDLVLDDGTRERPRYQFGTADVVNKLVRITDITHQGVGDDGSQSYSLSAVVDDERVHTRDNHLLPAPGEEQNLPVPGVPGGGDGGGGGDVVLIVDMSSLYAVEGSIDAGDNYEVTLGFRFNPDGMLSARVAGDGSDTGWVAGAPFFGTARPARWQRFAPIEDTDAVQYEVWARFQSTQIFDPADSTLTGAINTWQGLGVERAWELAWDRGSAPTDLINGRVTRLKIEVREAATGVVQDTATLQLAINLIDEGGS